MTPSNPIRIAILLAAAALLASCAWVSSVERQDTARAARFNTYAGEPVEHFTWLTQHRGWAALSSDQLIAWSDFKRPYLITVAQPCPDLWFEASGITSTLDEVHAHTNHVLAAGRRCAIQSIRPIDYLRMRHDLERRQADAGAKTPDGKARG